MIELEIAENVRFLFTIEFLFTIKPHPFSKNGDRPLQQSRLLALRAD
ncbi:MAG: hypothetical protein HC936_10490 [Leptolyngbyaceae cyanobacterium SU_3_3]|nr:hypothetical protein [Leptolyngbyaceae cyanobacterium SU_3_3]